MCQWIYSKSTDQLAPDCGNGMERALTHSSQEIVWKEISAGVRLEEEENIHHIARSCLVPQSTSSKGSG